MKTPQKRCLTERRRISRRRCRSDGSSLPRCCFMSQLPVWCLTAPADETSERRERERERWRFGFLLHQMVLIKSVRVKPTWLQTEHSVCFRSWHQTQPLKWGITGQLHLFLPHWGVFTGLHRWKQWVKASDVTKWPSCIVGNARAAFKKQPTGLALLSDIAEPKISAVLFHAFYFLFKTQSLHYPECNWLCYPLRRSWVEISFTKLKAVLLNGSTHLLMTLWFYLIPKCTKKIFLTTLGQRMEAVNTTLMFLSWCGALATSRLHHEQSEFLALQHIHVLTAEAAMQHILIWGSSLQVGDTLTCSESRDWTINLLDYRKGPALPPEAPPPPNQAIMK